MRITTFITYKKHYSKYITALHTLMGTSLIKNFFIYSAGAFFLRSVTICITPFILRAISPDQYGVLSLSTSFISITTAIMGLGLRQVLSIEYFHCTQIARNQLINRIMIIYLMIGIPLFLFLVYYRHFLQSYLFLHTLSSTLLILIFFITFASFFSELFYQVLQYEQQAVLLTSIQVGGALLTACISCFLVFYWSMGIASILIAQGVLIFLVCCLGIYTYYKSDLYCYISVMQSIRHTPIALKLGLPFIPSVLFGWLLACSNRWTLVYYSSLHDVGIYTIADTLSQLFYFLVLYPWSGSYLPYILNQFAHNQHDLHTIEQWNKHVMYWCMVIAAGIVTIGCIVIKPMICFILPPLYHEAINYLWMLLLGQVFLLGSYFAACFIQFHKRTYFLACALCIPALLNIGLNIILIPYCGLYGCTSATLISYAIYFMLTLWYNYRLQNTLYPH